MDQNMESFQAPMTPNTNPTPVAPSAAPVENSKPKGLIILTAVASILALLGAAAGAFFFADSNSKAQEVSQLKSKIDLLKTETGAELVEKQENGNTVTVVEMNNGDTEVIDDKVRTLVEELSYMMRGRASYSNSYYRPLTKYGELKAQTHLDKWYGVKKVIEGDDIEITKTNIRNEIVDKLQSSGFVPNENVQGAFGNYENNFIDEQTGIICAIYVSTEMEVSCGHQEWLFNSTKKLVNQLAEAFYSKEGKYPTEINVDESLIANSTANPYQTISASLGNASGLFYRLSLDSDWQYFTSTQAILSCEKYDTDDLKNAFAGERCYNEATDDPNATVQP